MKIKELSEQLNVIIQCRKYKIPLWQCPNFLFLIMGLIIIFLIFLSFAITSRFIQDLRIVSLIVLFIAAILLVLAFIINRSFEKLAEANKIKSEFVNIVSHQLRAPVANIKWSLELLTSGRLGEIPKSQIKYFKILQENSERMELLLNDLLIVSRIEMEKLQIKKEKISLVELTKEIIDSFEKYAKSSNVQIEFSFQENLPKFPGDKFLIKKAIENLLDNAIRYTNNNGLVKIKIENRKNKIYFEIEDNGVGIPLEEQKFIFQKLFRASNILKYKTQGTGLGLYITKAIIEKSKGKINFLSQEGKGSKFWFYLPTK